MAGFNGRELTIDWDSTTLVGVRSRGANMQNSLVDITNDDDSGWRTLLATPGMKMVDVPVAGITSDEVLIAEFFNSSVTGETLQINLPSSLASPGNISGTFMLADIEITGEHDGAVEFTATMNSSGEVTYTASSA